MAEVAPREEVPAVEPVAAGVTPPSSSIARSFGADGVYGDPAGLVALLAAAADEPRAQAVNALQRAAGNQSVGRLIQRAGQRLSTAGNAALQRTNGAGDKDVVPDPVDVSWAGDPFRMSFERTDEDGGRFVFVLTYLGTHPFDGPGVEGRTARLSVMIGPQKLAARVTRNDSTTVAVDLYGDGSKIVKVVDKPSFDDRPFSKGREHDLSAVDLGRSVYARSVWVRDPKASAADIPEIKPEESPGSNPVSKVVEGGATEITIDGDGDQHKDLKLTLRASSKWDDGDAAKTVQVDIVQLSTGESRQIAFDLPKPPLQGGLWPLVKEVTDGSAPTRISLITPIDSQFLEIAPPEAGATGLTYAFSAGGKRSTVQLPAEKDGAKKIAGAEKAGHIGNIVYLDLTLGAYNDRFRVTIEPLSDTTATFGIAARYKEETKGGLGAPLTLAGPVRYAMVDTGPTSAGIDLDGDGKPDLRIFDRLTTPTAMTEPGGSGPPEANRDHQIRVVGAAIGGERTFSFKVREGLLFPSFSDRADDKSAARGQTAVDALRGQEKEGANVAAQLDSYEIALMGIRKKAADEKVIAEDTYTTWAALSATMIKIRPQLEQGVPADLQAQAATQAQAFYKALDKVAMPKASFGSETLIHPYTGEVSQGGFGGAFVKPWGAGPDLAPAIQAGLWKDAFQHYQRLVSGFDKYIVERLKAVKGEHAKETQAAELLGGRRAEIADIERHKPVRVMAVFHPDEAFRGEQGYVDEIPLVLYAYNDGKEWHLKDVTNPQKLWDYTVDAKEGETEPPHSLLAELDDADHFPKGLIHYQTQGGRGGRVATKSGMTWKKFFTYASLVLAGAALALTAGPQSVAVYASWAFAGSAAAGAIAAGIDLAEKGKHGQLTATSVIIDLGIIASSLAGISALRAGRIVKGAMTAAEAGTPLTGRAAEMAVFYGKVYVPLRGAAIGADVITLAAISVDTAKQLDEIENGHGAPEDKARAKLLLLAQLGGAVALQALQIKGELPQLGGGRNIELYFPKPDAEPVAIVTGMAPPTNVKFSQKDVAPTTGDKTLTIDQLTESMKTGGWKGDPIDVVEFPDARGTVSIDNRRLLAAQNAGLKEIPLRYHAPNEPFNVPAERIAEGFELKVNLRRVGEDLVVGGTKGEIVFGKGTLPKTWEEAALFRTANQGNIPEGGKFPLWGRLQQPVVRKPKTPAPAGTE